MRLVWSQTSVPQDRGRSMLLLAVVCIFLGGVGVGRPGLSDAPKPVRAAAASLLATGGLFLVLGGAARAFRKRRKPGSSLSLAEPSDASADPRGFRKEEQR